MHDNTPTWLFVLALVVVGGLFFVKCGADLSGHTREEAQTSKLLAGKSTRRTG